MSPWDDVLNAEEIEALWAYVVVGEMPWVSRATAIKPDLLEVGPTMPNVKGANVRYQG